MARACMFCGTVGESTREDIFPKWLLADIKGAGFSFQKSSRTTDADPEFLKYPSIKQGSAPLNPQGKFLTRKVCGPCNNGWMGDGLEKPFAQAFKAMVRGDFDSVTEPGLATLLIRWAIKTNMVYDEALGSKLIYTPAERAEFRMGELPANTDVCMTIRGGPGLSTGSDYTGVIPGQDAFGNDRFAWASIIYAGPMLFLIRRATTGNDLLGFVTETQYFARNWIPLMSALPHAPWKPFYPEKAVPAFIDDPLRERRK